MPMNTFNRMILSFNNFTSFELINLNCAASMDQDVGLINIIHIYFLTSTKKRITASKQSNIVYKRRSFIIASINVDL